MTDGMIEFTEEEVESVYDQGSLEFTEAEAASVHASEAVAGPVIAIGIESGLRVTVLVFDGNRLNSLCKSTARLRLMHERAQLAWYSSEVDLPEFAPEFEAEVEALAKVYRDAFVIAAEGGPSAASEHWDLIVRFQREAHDGLQALFAEAQGHGEAQVKFWKDAVGAAATFKLGADLFFAAAGTYGGPAGALGSLAYGLASGGVSQFTSGSGLGLAVAVSVPATGVSLANDLTDLQLHVAARALVYQNAAELKIPAQVAAKGLSTTKAMEKAVEALVKLKGMAPQWFPMDKALRFGNVAFGVLSAGLAVGDYVNVLRKHVVED